MWQRQITFIYLKYLTIYKFFTLPLLPLHNYVFIVGVKYFDTKVDSPDKVITWEFGSGEFSPAVEEALLGMHYYLIYYTGVVFRLIS